MSDVVALQLANKSFETWENYTVTSDLYTAADQFDLTLSGTDARGIKAGAQCELFVNDQLELTGVIDRVSKHGDKRSRTVTITGRDLMGLLVDSCCETFMDVEGKKLSELAKLLIAPLPYVNRKKILYQADLVGKLGTRKKHGRRRKKSAVDDIFSDDCIEVPTATQDSTQQISRIEPGMTVFEVLRNYAASRGQMFWSMPDGTMVFGRPKVGGDPAFQLIRRLTDAAQNNILIGEENDDISGRYSKITVVGQQQGRNSLSAAAIQTKGVLTDDTFPFYKPYVHTNNNDGKSPAMQARFLMEQHLHQGYQLMYTVQGHSQAGRNWTTNELARVVDEEMDINKTLLIYARTFSRSREQGTLTQLSLGKAGLVAS